MFKFQDGEDHLRSDCVPAVRCNAFMCACRGNPCGCPLFAGTHKCISTRIGRIFASLVALSLCSSSVLPLLLKG